MPQQQTKKWLGLFLQLASASAFAQQMANNPDMLQNSQMQGGSEVSRAAVDQVKLVLYRDPVDYFAPHRPAKVFIDDVHIKTLDRKEYTTVCMPAGRYKISSHLEDALIYSDKNRKHLYGTLNAGETYLIKINTSENSGGELNQVDRVRFANEMRGLKMAKSIQDHEYYISKEDREKFARIGQVIQDCREYVPPPPPPVVVPPPPPPKAPVVIKRNLTLGADGTFAINRYNLGDLRAEGRRKIDESLAQIRNQQINVTAINVVGHADRLGKESHNQFLSQKRAETIKSYLVASGISPQIIMASGRSSSEPIVTCTQKKRSELVKCLEPNRRIAIDFTGIVQE